MVGLLESVVTGMLWLPPEKTRTKETHSYPGIEIKIPDHSGNRIRARPLPTMQRRSALTQIRIKDNPKFMHKFKEHIERMKHTSFIIGTPGLRNNPKPLQGCECMNLFTT